MMRKIILILFLGAFLSSFSRQVNVGVFDFRPASFKDENGRLKGLYIDLIDAIAKENDWEIIYHYDSFHVNLNKLRSGKLDLMPGIIVNKERLTFLDYSSASILTGWSSFNHNKKYKIRDIKDLDNKKIGFLKNDANNEVFLSLFSDNNITPRIKYYDEFTQMLNDIRLDSIVGGIFRNIYYEWEDPKKMIVPSNIKFPITESFFAVPKGKNNDLLQSIDLSLSNWKSDNNSTYYKILDKWLNPQADFFKNIISISLILIFIIFTYFLYRIYKKSK